MKGDLPVTGEDMAMVVEILNSDYANLGLHVKNMTCYVRFEDERGRLCSPTDEGRDVRRTFHFPANANAKTKAKADESGDDDGADAAGEGKKAEKAGKGEKGEKGKKGKKKGKKKGGKKAKK